MIFKYNWKVYFIIPKLTTPRLRLTPSISQDIEPPESPKHASVPPASLPKHSMKSWIRTFVFRVFIWLNKYWQWADSIQGKLATWRLFVGCIILYIIAKIEEYLFLTGELQPFPFACLFSVCFRDTPAGYVARYCVVFDIAQDFKIIIFCSWLFL